MYKILAVEELCTNTKLYTIDAPAVARKARPGQFVAAMVDEQGERIPLSICDWNRQEGWIQFVIQAIGATSLKSLYLKPEDSFFSILGPLGQPSEIDYFGTVVLMGGGFGVAAIYPVAREMKEKDNRVISMFGARRRDLLFWEDKLLTVSDQVLITTNDGSYGRQGLVIDPLKDMLEQGVTINRVFGVGPVPMMRALAELTRPYSIKTISSLNPIMVDATGLCGACRVNVGGQVRFGCFEGPDFDAHQVDWDVLATRQKFYLGDEKLAYERAQKELSPV